MIFKNLYVLKNKIPAHIFVALSAWLSKIVLAVVQIIAIRILLSYLGEDRYAVYVIAYSLLAWCSLTDFGVSSALQNYISESRVKNTDYSKYLKASLQIMISVFAVFFIMLALFSGFLQNTLLKNYLHIPELQTTNILFTVCFIFMLTACVNITIKIYYALQRGTIPNLLQLAANLCSLVLIIMLSKYFYASKSILYALLCFSLPQMLAMSVPFVKLFRPVIGEIFIFDRQTLKSLFIRALKFGGFSMMALAVLQIDYIVMAKTLNSLSITSYNVFNKVFLFIFVIYGTLLGAFWPVSAELFHSGKFTELKTYLRKYLFFGILLMICSVTAVFIMKDFIAGFLAPGIAINVSVSFFMLITVYYILRVISDTYATFLQSINVLKIFWMFVPVQACISASAQYFLSLKYGINGIIAGLILSFIFTSAWILPYKTYKIFKAVKE